ncbi:MAG: chromosomal replication initiator protein DnaA [Clostridia bacterium]|nr:chromosomal replication initiator protein DnaA [Clostridia bacterium]
MHMDMKELWDSACELLKSEINPVSYQTWIENNLTPVKLENDVLTLRIGMEAMKVMVNNRYVPLISNCISQVAGHRISVTVLTSAELENDEIRAQAAASSGLAVGSVQLNPKYTFDTFVVGSNNRFAHAASLAVAESPADAYNPLFIHGGVGLGKTHLMHAIGHYVQQQYPEKRLLYITSENFTNELISAIQQNRNTEFRNRFRNVDILMVDDIQFIAGRDSTQEEFFHTFNALHTAGKQIILTSDKPPQEINRLEERLSSRFAWGLIADIARPDIETRIAILREKARQDHVNVGDDVLELIASNVDSNIRELEGSLTRLVAYANLVGEPITAALCQDALRDIFVKKTRAITAETIMQTVSNYYGITTADLISSTRRREITVPRQIAIYLTREMTTMSLPQIGQAFGNRDHSTILHSCNTVAANIKSSSSMSSVVNDIKNLIKEGK